MTVRRFVTSLLLTTGLLLASTTGVQASASPTTSATQVRGDVTSLVSEYEATYGPRVSSTQRAELRLMTREARQEMNSLVRLVRKAERTNKRTDWRRAHSHYTVIRLKGDERLDDARDIIGPQMSFTEQLSAWSQARTVMQDLDSLGAELARRAG